MFWNIVLWVATFALNLLLTPKPQDAKRASLDDFDFPTAEEGREIPVLFGTKTVSGPNVVWYGDFHADPIKGPRRYGLFGPRQILGWKYYLGIQMGICHGVIDTLRRITIDGKAAWRGWSFGGRIHLDKGSLFGGDKSGGGVSGDVDIEGGSITQGKNDYLVARLGAGVPAYRGVSAAVLRRCYLGTSPHIMPWEFTVQRVFKQSDGSDQWYIQQAGLGVLDVSDTAIYFAIDVSGSMYYEGGIDMERRALVRLIDMIRDNSPSKNIDIRMVAWDDTERSSITKRNITKDSDFEALKTWINVNMDGGGGTDFTAGFADVVAYFLGSDGGGGLFGNLDSDPGSGEKRRLIIFVTDGQPNDSSTAAAAAAILAEIPDLEVYGFNIQLDDTSATEVVDNTISDHSWEIYSRIFSADGTEFVPQFRVNIATIGAQYNDGWITDSAARVGISGGIWPEVATVWRSQNAGTGKFDIYLKLYTFNSIGPPWYDISWSIDDTLVSAGDTDRLYASLGVMPGWGADSLRFCITWTSADVSTDGIYARIYEATGPQTAEFQVNTTTGGHQRYSKVVGFTDKTFVIVWQSFGADDTGYAIRGQQYSETYAPLSTEFTVNTQTGGVNQTFPAIARRADEMLIAVWLTDDELIEQSILNPASSMAVISSDVVIATTTLKGAPSVAALSGGGHVVVWAADGQNPDSSDYGIFGQLYDALGVKVGTQFIINTTTAGEQSEPTVSGFFDGDLDGGFVVAWKSLDQDGDGYGIYSQRFDELGAAVGVETLVNALNQDNQIQPKAVCLDGGRYAIQWQDPNGPPVPVIAPGDEDHMVDTLSSVFKTNFDMNPAHIIRECLINSLWGMGYNGTDIDDSSFRVAADTLFEEEFGLSLFWQREDQISEFITTVLSHIDAMLYVSKRTGKFVLKLIRPDYDIEEIPVITEDDVVDWTEVKRRQPSEAVNSLLLKYYDKSKDKDGSVAVHNPAGVKTAGGVISAMREYPGITKKSLAIRVAQRDLSTLSSGMADGRILCKRSVEGLNPGDPFRLVSNDQGFQGEVMRVMEISHGDGRKNAVTIKFVQDVFVLSDDVIVDDSPSDWELPQEMLPVTPRMVQEMNWVSLLREMGPDELDAMLASDAGAGLMISAGGQPNGFALNAELRVDAGAGYEDIGILDFCPAGFITLELKSLADELTVTLTDSTGLGDVQVGWIASIGEEIVRIDGVAGNILTLGRGCIDTVLLHHAAGEGVLIFEETYLSDLVERSDADSIEVRMQTNYPLLDILSLNDSPANVLVYASRAQRPYPPGKLQINALYRPVVDATYEITWTHRDRVGQKEEIIDHTGGDHGPEVGQTYRVDLYALQTDGTLAASPFLTEAIPTGTTYTFDPAADVPPPEAVAVTALVTSLRSGYESWQSARLAMPLAVLDIAGTPVLSGTALAAYTPFTVTASGGVPPYLFSVFSGALPPGIALNAVTGVVGGTPSAAGTYAGIVLRVTDYFGNTADLDPFTIVIAESALPEPFIFMDFVNGVYQLNGVDVPLSDLATDVENLTAKGLQTWESDPKFPVATALFNSTYNAAIAATGVSVAFEYDRDNIPVEEFNYALLLEFIDSGTPENGFYDLDFYLRGVEWHLGTFAHANNIYFWPTLNRGVITVSRPVGSEFWYEFAVQGDDQGRLLSGADFPIFDTVPESAYIDGDIDSGTIGSNLFFHSYNPFYIRKLVLYPALSPDNQINVAASGMDWDTKVDDIVPDSGAVDVLYGGFRVFAFGGLPPYSYTITSGSLPPGLSIDGHGRVSGTPTTLGTYTFSITAADSDTNSTELGPFVIRILDHFLNFIGSGQDRSVFSLGGEHPNRLLIVSTTSTVPITSFGVYPNDGVSTYLDMVPLTQYAIKRSQPRDNYLDGNHAGVWACAYPTGDDVLFYVLAPGGGSTVTRVAAYVSYSGVEMAVRGGQPFDAWLALGGSDAPLPAPGPEGGYAVGVIWNSNSVTFTDAAFAIDADIHVGGTHSYHLSRAIDTAEPDLYIDPSSSTYTGAFVGVEPAARPFVPWYSYVRPAVSAVNYQIDLSGLAAEEGDRLLAFVMHRTDVSEVPEGWELVDKATATGAAVTQYTSLYQRRARAAEGWESWKFVSVTRINIQVVAARCTEGELEIADYATAAKNNDTATANVFDLAGITATADDQMVIGGASSITANGVDTQTQGIEPVAGVWGMVPEYNSIEQTTSYGLRMVAGWRTVMNGEAFTGSFINYSLSPTNSNGVGSISALLDLANLTISGDPLGCAMINETYPGFTISAAGGTGPYTFSVQSGTLPTGLSLDTGTGLVSGTPSAAGIYQGIVLRVTDSAAATKDLPAFTVFIVDGPLTLELVHTATAAATSPTFAGVNFGAAHPTRMLIASLTAVVSSAFTSTVASVTSIGGAAAVELLRAQHRESETGLNAHIAMVPLASGTSGSIVVAGSVPNRYSLAVYSVINAGSLHLFNGDQGAYNSFTDTVALSLPAGSGYPIIATAVRRTTTPMTPGGNLTVDYAVSAGSAHYGVHSSLLPSTALTGAFSRPAADGTPIVGIVIRGNDLHFGRITGTSTVLGIGQMVRPAAGAAAGTSDAVAMGSPAVYDVVGAAAGTGAATALGTRLLPGITVDQTNITCDDSGTTVDRIQAPVGSASASADAVAIGMVPGVATASGSASVLGVPTDLVPSYSQEGGTGARGSLITISSNITFGGGSVANLIDGSILRVAWFNGSESLRTLTFDFGAGNYKVISEFRWRQDVNAFHGVWVWEGSQDGTNYVMVHSRSIASLGGLDITQALDWDSFKGYRYYRFRQVSGTTSTTPFVLEIDFKIAPAATPVIFGALTPSLLNPGGRGDRTASVTASTTATLGGGTISNSIDGAYADNTTDSWWWNSGQSTREVKFDFVSDRIITGVIWAQSSVQTHGTWSIQGSPDASAWTNLSTGLDLGGNALWTAYRFVNTTGYRYYRLLQTAGTVSQSPWLEEVMFEIAATSTDGVGSSSGTSTAPGVAEVPGVGSSSGTSAVLALSPGDPYFANVVLLLGFDGVDAATSTTDESLSGHSITFTGGAQLDTAQQKFGSASLLLDGSGDYITSADSADWNLGAGQFTMEGFFRFAATPTNCILFTQWSGGWALYFESGNLFFRDGNIHDSAAYSWSPSLNTWHHIAVDRDGSGVLRIYVDGVMQVKTTGYTYTIPDASTVMAIGSLAPAGFGTVYDLNGWVDEVRFTKGVARYASDAGLTVPTASFPRN